MSTATELSIWLRDQFYFTVAEYEAFTGQQIPERFRHLV